MALCVEALRVVCGGHGSSFCTSRRAARVGGGYRPRARPPSSACRRVVRAARRARNGLVVYSTMVSGYIHSDRRDRDEDGAQFVASASRRRRTRTASAARPAMLNDEPTRATRRTRVLPAGRGALGILGRDGATLASCAAASRVLLPSAWPSRSGVRSTSTSCPTARSWSSIAAGGARTCASRRRGGAGRARAQRDVALFSDALFVPGSAAPRRRRAGLAAPTQSSAPTARASPSPSLSGGSRRPASRSSSPASSTAGPRRNCGRGDLRARFGARCSTSAATGASTASSTTARRPPTTAALPLRQRPPRSAAARRRVRGAAVLRAGARPLRRDARRRAPRPPLATIGVVSGSLWYVDPNATSAWNGLVSGSKR